MSEIIFWSQVLQWVVILFIVILTLATMFLTGDAVRTLGPEKGAPVPKDGLPLGERVPAVMLTDARSGHSMRLDKPPDKPLMIAFLGERCSPCRALEPHLNWVAKRNRKTQFVAVVDAGSVMDNLARLNEHIWVVEDIGGKLVAAFDVRRVPLVYVIDRYGLVAIRTVANGRLDLEDALDGAGHLQEGEWVAVNNAG